VKEEYAHEDYSSLKAFLVVYCINDEEINRRNSSGIRKYITGVRPTHSAEWSELRLVNYSYDTEVMKDNFREILYIGT